MDTVLAGLVDETTLTEVVGVNEETVEVAVVVPEAEIETDTVVCVLGRPVGIDLTNAERFSLWTMALPRSPAPRTQTS